MRTAVWRCKQSFLLWPITSPPDLPPSDIHSVRQCWHNQGKQRWSGTQPREWVLAWWKKTKFRLPRPLRWQGQKGRKSLSGFGSICNRQAPGLLPVGWFRSAALAAPTAPRLWSQILTQQVWAGPGHMRF